MRIVLATLLSCLLLSAPVHAALTIDSIVALTSTCQNNGGITIYAHDSIAISYAITSGPITESTQATGTFSALPAGTYGLLVSDAAGYSESRTVTVGGSYALPDPEPKVIYATCLKTSQFLLIGNLAPGTGSAPFSWQLVSPSPVIVGAQPSDTFVVTSSGTYTMKVTDACGNVQTKQYTFDDPGPANLLSNTTITENLIGCDSVSVDMIAFVNGDSSRLSFPYRIILDNGSGATISYTQTAPTVNTAVHSGGWTFLATPSQVEFSRRLLRSIWGNVIQATLIDGCGDTVTNTAFISGTDAISYSQNWTTFSAGTCQVKNSNDFTYTMPKPNQWVLINNTTRAVVKTGTNLPDSASSSANDVFISGVNADTTYMLKVFDHCGDTLSTSFLWPEAYITPRYYMGAEIFACLDSTSAEDISYTGYSSGMTLTILSGPAGAHSSKPGYAYNYTYTYPRVFHNANTDGDFHLSDLAAGTYVYTIADSCGHTNTDSFSINSAFLVTFSNSFSYLRGCNNENTLTFQFIGSQGTFAQIKINCQITNTATGDTLFNNLVTGFNIYDSVYNVPAGTYKLSAQYVDVGYNMTNGSSCSQVTATVTVLPYRNPALSSVTDVICGGSIYITALMDSATGVPPYTYQVINGPQVTSTQSSNKFTVSKYGTYTILALDACGNSTTQSKQIDSTAGIMRVTNHIDSCFSATVAGQTYTTNTVLIDTIQNSLGCDSLITTDSISIRGNGDQLPILTVAADTFCITKGGTVTAVSSYASYLWGDGSTGLSIHVSAAGSYGLTVTDAVGCTHSDAAVVSLIDSPYVTNGWFADTAACPDAPVVVGLAVNDPDAHYQWGGTDAGTFGLTRTIVDSGIYTFSISNSCASSSYTMNVANKMYCYEYLYVPNAFTPNGDGVNDVFLIYTDYNLKLTNLQIFDRWGEKVYEGHDESQGWDGTYKGTAQPGGMYVYQLDATWLGGNTFHRRGSLTLLR